MSQLLATRRRHAAILVADVVGYTRLMEAAEDDTHSWLMRLRSQVLDPGVTAQGGRVVKNTGDGFVAIFDSATEAAECALALQGAVTAATAEQSIEQRISFRMAVNAADIIVEEDDVYGVGVNVAARLQAYAEPGGVIVSGAVAEQLGTDQRIGLIDLGDLQLRNLTQPVRVLALRNADGPVQADRRHESWCRGSPINRRITFPNATDEPGGELLCHWRGGGHHPRSGLAQRVVRRRARLSARLRRSHHRCPHH